MEVIFFTSCALSSLEAIRFSIFTVMTLNDLSFITFLEKIITDNCTHFYLSCLNTMEKQVFEAVEEGNVGRLKMLLNMGAKINVPDSKGYFPLHFAAALGKLDCLELLLNHDDVDINCETVGGETPVLVACSVLKDKLGRNRPMDEILQCVLILLQHGADPNIYNEIEGTSILIEAIHLRSAVLVKAILDCSEADVNAADTDGHRPINHAIHLEERHILNLLLAKNADLTLRDDSGMSVIHWATAHCNNEQILRDLLSEARRRGQIHIIDSPNHKGHTALMMAGEHSDNPKKMSLLLEFGANPYLQDFAGNFALNYSLGQSAGVLSQLLAKMGNQLEEFERRSESGFLPRDNCLHLATRFHKCDCLKAFFEEVMQ